MQKIVSLLVCLCFVVTGYAQSTKEILKTGLQQYEAKDYGNALRTYKAGLKAHPKNAQLNFRTGLTYLSLPNKTESLRYLQTAFTINPKVDENIYYYLGVSYQCNRQFEKAREFFNEYKKRNKGNAFEVDKKIRESQFADSLTRIPTNAVVENVGKAINSSFHEYSPLVSTDGNTMIFTSNRPEDGKAGNEFSKFEDIYISKRVNGQWTKPEKISPNINIKFNDAAASLSGDGKTLVLYYEYGGGDIYVSTLAGDEWAKPIPLNANINTPMFWETSAYLASDAKKLYFTSNRPGGYGNLDIYVSEMEQTGDWGRATNLGPVINTPGKEDSPVIDPNGVTLYFSSDGHQTMGGTDIFKSEFKDGAWQKPVNLGSPINSIEDDSFFALTGDRRRAYFSTLREEGNAEIYTLTFIEPEQTIASLTPDPVVQKKVIDTPPAEVTRSVAPGKRIADNFSPPSQPAEEVAPATLPVKPDVASTETTSTNTKPSTPRRSQAVQQPSQTASIVTMPGVRKFLFFGIGKDDLGTQSLAKLDVINTQLIQDTQMNTLIEGHTDNTGSELLNKALSIKRANAVAKYLTQNGVDPDRISLKAYGSQKPIVSNDDEIGGREINRRIEISFLK